MAEQIHAQRQQHRRKAETQVADEAVYEQRRADCIRYLAELSGEAAAQVEAIDEVLAEE